MSPQKAKCPRPSPLRPDGEAPVAAGGQGPLWGASLLPAGAGGSAGWGRLVFTVAPSSRPHTQRSRRSSWLVGNSWDSYRRNQLPLALCLRPQPASGLWHLALTLPPPTCRGRICTPPPPALRTLTSARPGLQGTGRMVWQSAALSFPRAFLALCLHFFLRAVGKMTCDCPWVPVFLLRPVLGEAEGGGSTPALFPPA